MYMYIYIYIEGNKKRERWGEEEAPPPETTGKSQRHNDSDGVSEAENKRQEKTLKVMCFMDSKNKVGLLIRNSRPTHQWFQNPVQILVPTRQRCTTSEGPWLNPDLVGKWSHSPAQAPFLTQAQPNPAKALPFLPQAHTNTILILNPSSNPLYSRSLDFPNIFTCAKSSQTNALPSLLAILWRILWPCMCFSVCESAPWSRAAYTTRNTNAMHKGNARLDVLHTLPPAFWPRTHMHASPWVWSLRPKFST